MSQVCQSSAYFQVKQDMGAGPFQGRERLGVVSSPHAKLLLRLLRYATSLARLAHGFLPFVFPVPRTFPWPRYRAGHGSLCQKRGCGCQLVCSSLQVLESSKSRDDVRMSMLMAVYLRRALLFLLLILFSVKGQHAWLLYLDAVFAGICNQLSLSRTKQCFGRCLLVLLSTFALQRTSRPHIHAITESLDSGHFS